MANSAWANINVGGIIVLEFTEGQKHSNRYALLLGQGALPKKGAEQPTACAEEA